MPFHRRNKRWSMLVAHRRAGKTVAAINDLIEKATYNTREAPRYAYVAPLLKQAKAIAWEYLKKFAAPYNPKISEAELYVELRALPNSPRITIYGADNPDAFRGMYFDGVVLDEYGNMMESVWKEVLLPALVDRRGWAVFMGTPNGPNHFRDMWYKRKKDANWFHLFLPVSITGIIAQDDLDEMQTIMEPEEFKQEMLCDFEAAVRGAIYARQMELMQTEGRIGSFKLDTAAPIDLFMDLGFKDNCTMGFCQSRPDGIVIGHSFGDSFRPIHDYIQYAKAFQTGSAWKDRAPNAPFPNPVREGPKFPGLNIWLPHDAKAKTLQTGKAIINHFREAKLRPRVVPRLDVIDGIAAVRKTFPMLYIDEEENETLILAAKSYRRKYDEDLKRYMDEPVHDWSSDWMDMVRYLCIIKNPKALEKGTSQRPARGPMGRPLAGGPLAPAPTGGLHYGFTLQDLFDMNEEANYGRR